STKLAMAFWRLKSSSASFLLLCRSQRKAPRPIPARAIRPTTTPTAIPTVLGPPPDLPPEPPVGPAVTTTVEAPVDDVIELAEAEAGSRYWILFRVMPVRYTIQKLPPPPVYGVSTLLTTAQSGVKLTHLSVNAGAGRIAA